MVQVVAVCCVSLRHSGAMGCVVSWNLL
jgi:hypothetical protein